jgi:Flp pilus assembly protein TadG
MAAMERNRRALESGGFAVSFFLLLMLLIVLLIHSKDQDQD